MSKYGLDTTESIFCMAIAILFPFFFYKLTNKLVGYEDVNSMCDDSAGYFDLNSDKSIKARDELENCRNEKQKKLEKIELNKHIMLVVIALIGIILTSVIQTNSTKLGVGLGGVFTLILALTLYWYKYNETTKLAISGVSLLLVTFLSVRLYKIDNIADLFAFEFGTK